MISVPQICRNKLENVINLSNTILLPIVAQLYEFYEVLEKLEKKRPCITINKKVAKQVLYENLQRDN